MDYIPANEDLFHMDIQDISFDFGLQNQVVVDVGTEGEEVGSYMDIGRGFDAAAVVVVDDAAVVVGMSVVDTAVVVGIVVDAAAAVVVAWRNWNSLSALVHFPLQ